jgi:hypothetical protein
MKTFIFYLAVTITATFSVQAQAPQKPIVTQTPTNTNNTVVSQNTTTQNTTTRKIGCISGDCVNGWGAWQFENGYYEGFWENGKRNGYGYYEWDTEGAYIGFFKDNVIEGYGSYENKDGLIKTGIYVRGMLNGMGEEVIPDLVWKQGYYTNHTLTQELHLVSNYVDEGCIAGNCQDSYGQYKWANGNIFIGFFKNGVQLLGALSFSNGDTYYGQFNQNGQLHGQGKLFYANGVYYGGEFQNGKAHGRGYFEDKDRKRQIGVWENNALVYAYLKD